MCSVHFCSWVIEIDCMEIRIHSYLAASFLLEQEPSRWDALVILDSKVSAAGFVQSQARRHTFLRFDDVDRAKEGRQVVTPDQLVQGFEFALESKQLLVSCRAGQSRSAAMAFLIACHNIGVDAALELIDPTKHVPNALVVSLGARVLDMPEALDAYEKWRYDNRHISLSDHYDQLECEFDALEARGAVNRIVAR